MKKRPIRGVFFIAGGRGEIRTHGGREPTTVFKTVALNRSATLPRRQDYNKELVILNILIGEKCINIAKMAQISHAHWIQKPI